MNIARQGIANKGKPPTTEPQGRGNGATALGSSPQGMPQKGDVMDASLFDFDDAILSNLDYQRQRIAHAQTEDELADARVGYFIVVRVARENGLDV